MQSFDFSPFYRSTVGFDRLFSTLDALKIPEAKSSYPPYNIERTGDDAYRISVAVAGFSNDEISIETKEHNLTVKGGKSVEEDQSRDFMHRGIAERAFDLRFQLADYVEVTGAKLENGLLHLDLKRELPESQKPRQIKISGAARKGKTIENKKAVN